jgi:hypothetical protein
MIAGFKEHGFMVAAEHMPDTCTKCPFWLTDLEMQYDGMCFLTGEVIPTPERTCDTKVMGNCPIVPLDRLKKKNTRQSRRNDRGRSRQIRRNRRLPVLGKQIQGGKRMNTPDARRIFEAIAMILSNRNDGVRVQLSEIKTKAAKAS